MTDPTRTIIRKTETSVTFSNDEVKAILLKAAGAPADIAYHHLRVDDASFYADVEIVWGTTETTESDQ